MKPSGRTWRSRRALAAALGVPLAGAAVAGALRARLYEGDDGAVIEVRRGTFVREVGAEGALAAVKATPLVAPIESGLARTLAWLAPDGSRVRAGDVVARFDPTSLRRELLDGRSDEAAARSRIESARAQGAAKTRGLALDRDLAEQESAGASGLQPLDPAIFSRHEVVTSELDRDLLETRRSVAERKLALGGRLAGAEEALARAERDKARGAIRRAARGLSALEVRAPHDGLLLLARDWRSEPVQTGQVVWPGQQLAEIPDLGALHARVHVLEADAGGLEAGRRARVVVEGAGAPPIDARVERVDAVAKPRDRASPVRYFETVLALEGRGRGFQPGQRVRATIELERLPGVVAVPRAAVFERDGRRVAFVLRAGGRPQAVEVVVGRNSVSHVVVESGLAPGDRVLLRDPGRPIDGLGAAPRDGEAPRGPGDRP